MIKTWRLYTVGTRKWRDALIIRASLEYFADQHLVYIEKHLALDNDLCIPERPLAQYMAKFHSEVQMAEDLDWSIEKRLRAITRTYTELPEILYVAALSPYDLDKLLVRLPAITFLDNCEMWYSEEGEDDDDL